MRAKKYLAQVAAQGALVLFVGTKRQAGPAVEREARRCGMPFVAERWLGGSLTNFRTIRSRLGRLEELEKIRGGEQIATYSKKMQSALAREYRKMYRNLNGIRTMNRLPECLVIIDPKKEKNAVNEARKLGITTVALIDTDCDPDLVDLPIPGNDDSIRSIELIMRQLADAVLVGSQSAAAVKQKDKGDGSPKASRSAPARPKRRMETSKKVQASMQVSRSLGREPNSAPTLPLLAATAPHLARANNTTRIRWRY